MDRNGGVGGGGCEMAALFLLISLITVLFVSSRASDDFSLILFIFILSLYISFVCRVASNGGLGAATHNSPLIVSPILIHRAERLAAKKIKEKKRR